MPAIKTLSCFLLFDEFIPYYNRGGVNRLAHISYKHIYEAANGLDAYEIYKNKALDLIITDIHMPKMDGLTLVEKIREERSDVPIIIISAYSDQEKLLRAVKLKLVDYIIKPITRKTLKELMQKVYDLNNRKEEQKKAH
ncbi:MAG: response regulator [Epsilonproteobacteria bacterium]|nr:response regulator [Campylobacterota bacterium]